MLDRFYAGSVFYLHELKVRFQVKLIKEEKQANRALHHTPKEVSKQGRLQKRAEIFLAKLLPFEQNSNFLTKHILDKTPSFHG
jgi:hypothetical protein